VALSQIPNLTPATAVNGSEELEAVQAGATVRMTSAQIASAMPADTVTNAMLVNMPALTIKANAQNIPAPPGDYSLSVFLDGLGATWGDVLYRGSVGWVALSPGTSGQVLQTHGAGANPSWVSTTGVGTVTQITAGAGLSGGTITASGTIASIETVNLQSGVTTYAFSSANQATLIEFTNNSAQINATLPGTALASGWWVDVQNTGSHALVITPASGTINGGATLTLSSGSGARIASNGTNYYIQGGIQSSSSLTLTGDVTGSGSGSIATTVGSIGGKTVSLAGALSTSGAYSIALTATGNTSLTLPTSGTLTALGNSVTGTGNIVLASSPTLSNPTMTTPTLGVATATSVNGLTITSGTGTLTIPNGVTFAVSGAFSTTLAVTGATTLTLPTSGTVTALGNSVTGSGAIVLAGSPTLTTPSIGDATGSSVIVSAGFGSTGAYIGSVTVGILIDYTAGFGRIGVGPSAGINLYSDDGATLLAAFSSAGSLTLGQGIVGTTAGGNAVSGQVGEYVSANVLVGSAVSLTTNIAANVTSISLTAGDWDVSGSVCFTAPGTTNFDHSFQWVSATSATFPTMPNSNGGGYFFWGAVSVDSTIPLPAGTIRINVSTTTTVYLSTRATFTISTLGAFGFIRARRVR